MYHSFFEAEEQALFTSGYYREFAEFSASEKGFPYAIHQNKTVTVWCSNNYLGMRNHPDVIAAAQNCMQEIGIGSGGTRNISGTHAAIVALETTLADFHNKEKALVFNSGFMANWTILEALGKCFPDAVFFSDEKNHASLIKGLQATKCEKRIFKHNDSQDLAKQLAEFPNSKPKIIVFESVYSMDGSIAPIKEFCDLAEKHQAITFLDEVHAVGLYGNTGEGMAGQLNLAHRIDLLQGTLGKAFGAIGGYVVGKEKWLNVLRHTASGFIFTTTLPPVICAAANASIQWIATHPTLRAKHQAQVEFCKSAILAAGLPLKPTKTHILPLCIGDMESAKKIQQQLLEKHQIYLQAIGYPTVDRNEAIFRITPTPFHSNEMCLSLVAALLEEMRELNYKTYFPS